MNTFPAHRMLRFQEQAARLKDLFNCSPLVLLYQPLGPDVTAKHLRAAMTPLIQQKFPDNGIKAECIDIPNQAVYGARNRVLGDFFHAHNLVVGFKMLEHSTLHQMTFKESTTLSQILGDVTTTNLPRSLPQPLLAQFIQLALGMEQTQPLLLLAAFHRGSRVRIADMKKWMKMDERQEQAALLNQIDLAPRSLCDNVNSGLQHLVRTMDSSAGIAGVLGCVEHRAAAG